ncbi:hypothetical protein ANCDUO_02027 [Ancylostoma duodenale]|uniref:MARVEL domain-containing protein n=1 Tax=Ancylostoma duodenale TaxID=51022 RepID=A0A0C2DXG3_9BILA|nr:hypothetical protein ANCDUO_02027 [Ancylostoma duodenale]
MPGVYNGGYSHEPYGQNAYIDSAYGDVQQYPYYGGYSYTPYYANGQAYHNQAYQASSQAYPGAYGPYPGASGAYRPYPQPQPSPPRRSRPAHITQVWKCIHQTREIIIERRGHTIRQHPVVPFLRLCVPQPHPENHVDYPPIHLKSANLRYIWWNTFVEAFSGPTKKPSPVYRKSRDPYNYRIAQYQVILGAAILGLVLGPMRGTSFHDFVIRTNTEWQGAVVGIVATWTIFTAVLLLTSFLANSVHMWRKVDAHVTLIAILAYLLASCLEAYYAACYPPNGPRINLVCHRAEWIIATILCFINTALYVLDFALSWLSGVTML